MTNLWKLQGVPHKGWTLVSVIDVRENGEAEWETDYETCMMCGNEKIRYVHIVEHPNIDKEFRVGCICAEKMTEDYIYPKLKENVLRNRANRRTNWLKKKWKTSINGNTYLNIEGRHVLIYKDKKKNKYKVKIQDKFGNKSFTTIDEAKVAAFNGIEYFKENGKW